jgi:predicted alpha/beta-fold hydrolase
VDFNCKVINARGLGGIKLYNEKMISSELFEDLWEYIQKLCKDYPDSQLFVCGFSFGGHILTRVLTTYADKLPKNFSAAAGVCYPICVKETEQFLNNFYGLYNAAIMKGIRKIFFNNLENIFNNETCKKEILEKKNVLIDDFKKLNKMNDYSEKYLFKIYNYDTLENYYDKGDLRKDINKINIPFLSWFTEDDPIVPVNLIPFDSFQKNSNTVTVVSEHGGHLGLFSGGFIPKRFISEPIKNFFKLIFILNENKQ